MIIQRKIQILIAFSAAVLLLFLIGILVSACEIILAAIIAGVGTAAVATFMIISNHKIQTRQLNRNIDDGPSDDVESAQ